MSLTRRHGDTVVSTVVARVTVEGVVGGAVDVRGTLRIEGDDGRCEVHALLLGDGVAVTDGCVVEAGAALYRRDRTTITYAAEIAEGAEATVCFRDLDPWRTVVERLDPVTFTLQRRVRLAPFESPWKTPRPRIELRCEGAVVQSFALEHGADLLVHDGDTVRRGDLLARLEPALPARGDARGNRGTRLIALLEARRPDEPAAVAPCSGVVARVDAQHLAIDDGAHTVTVERPRRAHAARVRAGEFVYAGEALTDGERDLRDLAMALGREAFTAHLADEIEGLLREARHPIEASAVERVVAALVARDGTFWGLRRR